MSLTIHVFIATSKGLVAIQSITELQDVELQSVITINGSTDLATISSAYQRFVQKSTGVIQSEFGGHSFRANISRNIDQGSSWQLPFYLAHFIQANVTSLAPYIDKTHTDQTHTDQTNSERGQLDAGVVQLGQGIPEAGDVVLIATGQINTSTGAIEAVNYVPDKCITASPQIKLWMKKGILVEFFVPANNLNTKNVGQAKGYQQTASSTPLKTSIPQILPALDCAIYPVIDINQLKEHVEQLLPSPMARNHNQSAHAVKLVAPAILSKQLNDNSSDSERVASNSSILSKKALILLLTIVPVFFIIIIAMMYWALNASAGYTDTRFISRIKSGLYCDGNALKKVSKIAQQYVSRIPTVAFNDACSLTLITAKQTPQVWLVADSKTLIELSSVVIDEEFHWTIPLPKQQHANREYVLVVTNQHLDLADLAACKSYLSRLEKTQKPSVEILASFFSKIDINPQYISQKLVTTAN
jgi:hypothetical protein